MAKQELQSHRKKTIQTLILNIWIGCTQECADLKPWFKRISQHISTETEFGWVGVISTKKDNSMQGRFCLLLPCFWSQTAGPQQGNSADSPTVCKKSGAVRLRHENWRNLKVKIQLSNYSKPSWTDEASTHEQATAWCTISQRGEATKLNSGAPNYF